MNRRTFVNSMMSTFAAAQVAAFGQKAQGTTYAAGRPNFLFLIADDHTFRAVQALGKGDVQTPNLDRLVASGTTFTHCFHQGSWLGAVCVPSRAMLNSGLSAFRARDAWLATRDGKPGGFETHTSWAESFRHAGYDTYQCGKWHLDRKLLQRGFTSNGPVGPGMFPSTEVGGDAYYRPRRNDPWQPWDESLKGHWLHTAQWEHAATDSIIHSDVLYANHAVDFLKARTAQTNPFFAYIGFNSPHDPRQSPKEFLARYPEQSMAVPPNFTPEFPFDQGDHKGRDEILAPFPRTKEAVQLHRREYFALVTYMDAQIGRILDALEASGQASNTYIVYTADHGLNLGEHGLMGKQNMFEASIRMPLVISGPNIAKNRRLDQMVYQHSMFPTTCSLAGVPIPGQVEFPDLSPVLQGANHPVQDAVFCYYKGYQRMVRTEQHKLIVYPYAKRTQLFNVQKDPWELNDLAGQGSTKALQASLLSRLKKFQHDLGDSLDLDNPGPIVELKAGPDA